MTRNPLRNKTLPMACIQHWALVALAFIIPFPHKIPHPVLYLLAVLWLTEILRMIWIEKNLQFLKHRFTSHGNVFIRLSVFLLIFFYIAGVLYSENLSSARFELEKKSLLLLFPLVVMTMPREVFIRELLSRIMTGFASGLLIVTAAYLVLATIRYGETGATVEFFYSSLSHPHHPGYLSMYVAFALGVTAWLLLRPHGAIGKLKAILLVLLMLWWIAFIFLLSSKIGFVSLLLVLVFIFILMFRVLHRRTMMIVTLGLVLTLLAISSLFSGTIRARFAVMQQNGLHIPDLSTVRRADGTVIRLISWEIALEQWKMAPVAGTGTGDYHDATWKELETRGLLEVFGGFKNAHNQFLQTAVTCGAVGFIALLMWIFVPLLSLKRPIPWINTLFIALLVINLMVESMLETQAGVMFIVFFQIILHKKLPEAEASGNG